MAKDKMTYNEFLGSVQTNAECRQYMGTMLTDQILPQKYIQTGARAAGYTFEQFMSLRRDQMARMYNVFTQMQRGTYSGQMRPNGPYDNTEEAVRRCTGPNSGVRNNGVIAIDSEDRTMILECVEMAGKMESNNPYYRFTPDALYRMINNTEAIKCAVEQEFGITVPITTLCRETTALEREAHIAQHTYEMPGFEVWTKYQRPSKFSKALKAISDFINGKKERPMGDKEIGS